MFNHIHLPARCYKPILVFLIITLCHSLMTNVHSIEVLPASSVSKKSSIVSAWQLPTVHTYRYRMYMRNSSRKSVGKFSQSNPGKYFNNGKKKNNRRCRKTNSICNPNKSQCCRGSRCRREEKGKKKFRCLKKPELDCCDNETKKECKCRSFWEDRSPVADKAALLTGIAPCSGTTDLDIDDNEFAVPLPICKYTCPGDEKPLQRTLFGTYDFGTRNVDLTDPDDPDCFAKNLKKFLPDYLGEGAPSIRDCEVEKENYFAFQGNLIKGRTIDDVFTDCNFNLKVGVTLLSVPGTDRDVVFAGTCPDPK